MSQNEEYINVSARIFFNTCFLAFTVFGLYMSFCEAYSYQGDYGKVFIISLISSFIMCILWINSSIWSNLGLFAVNAGTIFIIIKNYRIIEKELSILYGYIKKQYYIYMNLGDFEIDTERTHIMLFGEPVYEKLALIIILIMLVIVIAMAALRIRWDFLVVLPVIIITGIEMFHGKAPSLAASCLLVSGVSGLLFGIKFEMYGGRKHFFQKRHVSGQMWTRYLIFVIITLLGIIVSLQAGSYTKDTVFANSEKALKKEHEIERKIKIIAEAVKSKVLKESDGYLDNKPPDQAGRFIMRIETDKKPVDNIYIRSFYADRYNGTRWDNSDKNPPLNEDDVNHMFSNGIEKLLGDEKQGTDIIKIVLYPEKKQTDANKYIPYMSKGYEESSSGYYTFYCYNTQSHIKNYILMLTDDELSGLRGIKTYKKYTSYVHKKYLSLPHNTGRLEKFAKKIDRYPETDLQCLAVKNAVCKNTKYSQNLKELPDGKDYIEYFLFEQKKGYCEHYATAGTILLRFTGVPARYAAGYSISPSEFSTEYDESGTVKYTAYVRDYNAHAWTEVYKRGFGWIPFDMTNQVSDDDYNSNITLSPDNMENQEPLSSDMQDKESVKPEEAGTDSSSAQEDINKTEDRPKKQDKQSSRYRYGTDKKIYAGLFVFFLMLIMLAVYNRIKFMLLFRKLGMAKTGNERVLIYFSILNWFLGFCGMKDISKLGDAEYIGKLNSIFLGKIPANQINSACEILQCAAFSNGGIEQNMEKKAVYFIKNASYEAYQNCKKPMRFLIYIFTGRNRI